MNKFAPKAEFLKRRAFSLHRSGKNPAEIAHMLQISKYTAYSWLTEWKDGRPIIRSMISSAEKAASARWSACELPTLAHVPQIELTPKSKYRMQGVTAHAI